MIFGFLLALLQSDSDSRRRAKRMDQLASSEPSLSMSVEANAISFNYSNLPGPISLRFYPMDIELLFSNTSVSAVLVYPCASPFCGSFGTVAARFSVPIAVSSSSFSFVLLLDSPGFVVALFSSARLRTSCGPWLNPRLPFLPVVCHHSLLHFSGLSVLC